LGIYTSFETGGLINKQYQNQDAAGRGKKQTGQQEEEDVATSEINMFFRKPYWVGVAKGPK
jgi:hypothetical protein